MVEPEEVELPVADRDVSRVDISRWLPFLLLQFFSDSIYDDYPGYAISISGPFRLRSSNGTVEIDPENGPHPVYLTFVHKHVQKATAYKDGSLRVQFTDGETLEVDAYEYEPWEFVPEGQGDLQVVSVAGGGLAIWNPISKRPN